MIPKEPGCYIINFIESGKFYVGSTGDLRRRWNDHLNALNGGNHRNGPLQKAYDDDRRIEIEYLVTVDRESAYELEQQELNMWVGNPNCINQGNDARLGFRPGTRPTELQARMNLQLVGRKRSEEQRLNIRAGAFRRPPVTQETRQKLSRLSLGRVNSEEHNEKIRQARLGVKRNESDITTRKRIIVDGVVYPSITATAEQFKVSRSTVNERLRSVNWPNWQYG